MKKTLVSSAVPACFAVMALMVLSASHADARSFSYTGRHGRTWNRTATTYNNGGGNYGRTITTTSPNGKMSTDTFSRSVNNGTVTRDRSYTGFNGQVETSTVTRTPGQGGTATYTGPHGRSYSGTTSAYNHGDGNRGRTTTFTSPTETSALQSTQTHNADGTFTDTRTLTTAGGRTYTQSLTGTVAGAN